jgi:hypothetical protein
MSNKRKLLSLALSFALMGAFMASIVVGQGVGSSLLSVDDFKDVASLSEKLRTQQDELSKYLYARLSASTKNLLNQSGDLSKPSAELLKALTDEFNNILRGPSLYEPSRFANVRLSHETEFLLRGEQAGDELVRLNRYLLDDAYPKEINGIVKFIGPSKPTTPPPTPRATPTQATPATPSATPAPPAQPVAQPAQPVANVDSRPFYEVLRQRNVKLPEDCSDSNEVGRRIVAEYGAVFVAQNVMPPSRCMFANEAEVQDFQHKAARMQWQGVILQSQALGNLLAAINEGAKLGVRISPRGGDATWRSFTKTKQLWDSRFYPALTHWTQRGRITPQEAARIRALPIREQVAAVLHLETQGLYFSKDLSKSILYSVAAPGSSQHIAMLAIDINEFRNPRVRELLAKYGWFQTVKSDLPHFTFLGVSETNLPRLGLCAVTVDGQKFWIPDVGQSCEKRTVTSGSIPNR